MPYNTSLAKLRVNENILKAILRVATTGEQVTIPCEGADIKRFHQLLNEIVASTEDFPEFAGGKYNDLRPLILFKRSKLPHGMSITAKDTIPPSSPRLGGIPIIQQIKSTIVQARQQKVPTKDILPVHGEVPNVNLALMSDDDLRHNIMEVVDRMGWVLTFNVPGSGWVEGDTKDYFLAVTHEMHAHFEQVRADKEAKANMGEPRDAFAAFNDMYSTD